MQNIVFDKISGKFIVMVKLTPEQYTRCAQDQMIADIDNVGFDNKSGIFTVPVLMSPAEYGQYIEDKVVPRRLINIKHICLK